MDTAHWPQDIVVKPMEEIVTNSLPKPSNSLESRKVRPHKEQVANCPRCNSTNTKFCYYNNYSLTQPRYFCKTCRRYWTEGGSLRNIPVGGGSRKNKRSSSSSSSSNPPSKKIPDHNLMIPQQNPSHKIHENHQDLNLGFSSTTPHDFKAINELIQVPNFVDKELQQNPSSSSSTSSHHHNNISALELLNGFSTTSRGLSLGSFMPNYTSGFPNLVPSLNFSLDGLGSNYGSFQGVQESSGKLLFPFQDLKQGSNDNINDNTNNNNANDAEQNRDQHGDSTGYWNGVIGGGSCYDDVGIVLFVVCDHIFI
ncbi:hypothetical protein BUALT_Bualt10G0007500 [Buddleja alternifolia]|uniref:Dof zinc finger protein n=1 Tax=Buddleja alternifolia TaxID=168488 RepID=A0AAV6X329_9LAMI|nr:hypothetical protein BUALT_Bualt10G0007500 [Buddleja alternifolia]